MNYIYLPVPSIEMTESANYLADFWKPMSILRNPHLRGWKKGANRRFGGGCLQSVAAGDKLFVVIHQYYGGVAASRHPELRATRQGWEHDHDDLKEYTGASLARAMEAEGLPKNFRDIYACICNSALTHPSVTQPFGRSLCDALQPKYPDVTVTGFRGFFRPGRFGIFVEAGPKNLVKIENPNTIKTEHAAIIETFS